jgi:hypothetical protein
VPRDVTRLGKGVVASVTGTIASSRAVERPLVRVDVDAARSICMTGGCTINNEMGDCGEMHPGS